MTDALKVEIKDRGVRRVLDEFPKIANQEFNRSYRRVGSEFGKIFTRAKLRRGVFRPKRRIRLSKTPPGQPTLPAKMRRAGFKAVITGRQNLQDKALSVRTSNPLLRIRETGGLIRPRRKKFLFIRGDFRGRGAKQRREAFEQAQQGAPRKFSKPIVAKVRSITVPAVLRFVSTFRKFRRQGVRILDKGVSETVRRAQLKLSRGR